MEGREEWRGEEGRSGGERREGEGERKRKRGGRAMEEGEGEFGSCHMVYHHFCIIKLHISAVKHLPPPKTHYVTWPRVSFGF